MASMISPVALQNAVSSWLLEDIPSFDVGGYVVGDRTVKATFFVKSPCVIAGFPFAEKVMTFLKCTVKWSVEEGSELNGSSKNRIPIGTVEGPAYAVLQGERTALEVLTRCSACASYARLMSKNALKKNSGWKGRVAATRKTTPGSMRMVEKYGASVGGADPHRYSLSAMVMLKDNHIDVRGSISAAVGAARKQCGFSTKIEVECRSVKDAFEAGRAGADVVMLDNFTPQQLPSAVRPLRFKFPGIIIEVSGGIAHDTIQDFAVDGVDIISVGRITHGPPPVDISMKIAKNVSKL